MKRWPRVTPTTNSSSAQSSAFEPVCLVHYHEIGLKGKNRSLFEKQLITNLKSALSKLDVCVKRISGYVLISRKSPYAKGNAEEVSVALGAEDEKLALDALEIVRKIPGVARATLAFKTKEAAEDYCLAAKIALSQALEASTKNPEELTFKVHAKRSATNYELHTLDLHQLVGAYLCESFPQLKVDVHHPDITVNVLIHQNDAYVYAHSVPGVGGLPVGTAGKIVSLFSSGFDSPVATWMMGRRGAIMIPVHFSGRPMVAQDSEELCQELCEKLNESGIIGRMYVVPFGEVQREIALTVPQNLRILMYRRMMYVVADKLAQIEGAKALCTGESLGQVASQTLENIYATSEIVTDMPILRPLIGSDKQEIIARAHELGTFDISATTAPDCCTLFMPKNPETHARMKDIKAAWDKLPVKNMVEKLLVSAEHVDYSACPAYRPPKET